jgi:hypothetical protein
MPLESANLRRIFASTSINFKEPQVISERKSETLITAFEKSKDTGSKTFYFLIQLTVIFVVGNDPYHKTPVFDPRGNGQKLIKHDAFHVLASKLLDHYSEQIILAKNNVNGIRGLAMKQFNGPDYEAQYSAQLDEFVATCLQLKDRQDALHIIQYFYFYFVLLIKFGINPLELGMVRNLMDRLYEQAGNGQTNEKKEPAPSLVLTKNETQPQ